MKRYIKASAMKKSDLAGDIAEKTIPVMNALAQLYYFPNNENKNHYFVTRRQNGMLKGYFIPWDMNISFGCVYEENPLLISLC